MPDYKRFGRYLDGQDSPLVLTPGEIEKIVGKLPDSAYKHMAWWANSYSHSLMKVVLEKGWRQSDLDVLLRKVEFRKDV